MAADIGHQDSGAYVQQRKWKLKEKNIYIYVYIYIYIYIVDSETENSIPRWFEARTKQHLEAPSLPSSVQS